jgi:hypothetical protein
VNAAPLGAEAAAKIAVALKERGKTWTDLEAECKKAGCPELIVGMMPADCPQALADRARVFCAFNPVVAKVDDFDAEVAALVQQWSPPASPPLTVKGGEVVDTRTGEVIDTSDIPF